MAPAPPRLRILSIGGNAVSAFLSWRLQATNACDITLVWKANFQAVQQYGISFKSQLYGNERFNPRYVVQTPEDAASTTAAFDYVLLCVKALPDVYNLADIVQSVVTPQHTCILVNTTNTLGVEKQLEERFPTNVVLSLVSGANLVQLGSSEFEHTGPSEIWVGPANPNSNIPTAIQNDMSEALAMTLTTAQVDCKVSTNIHQQQFDRMIGPIAFYPASVLFECSTLSQLIQKPGVHELVSDVIDELLNVASALRCMFSADFKQRTIQNFLSTQETSTMYQDYTSRRPMEVETYLGAPSVLGRKANVPTPRIDTLYTLLRHVNKVNQERPQASEMAPQPAQAPPPPRSASIPQQPNGRPMGPPMNGMNGVNGMNGMNGNRPYPPRGPPGMGPGPRRGPPPVNGYRGPPPNAYGNRPGPMNRRPSFDQDNLDEFSHVVLYDELPEGDLHAYADGHAPNPVALRERELMLREKELALKHQEMAMRGKGGRRPPPSKHQEFDDDDDDDDGFDPMNSRGPAMSHVDVDNLDMMSVTSRRNKRAPSQGQLRKGMYTDNGRPPSFQRPYVGKNRTSTAIMGDMPSLRDDIMNNPMMAFSNNRYGNVDRKELADESRANSLTASRMQEIQNGPYPNRRTSRSPGNPLGPPGRQRPSPPNDPYMQGPPRNGRPSPPGMQAPTPRYPPGNNMIHPVEQHIGVSKPFPPPKAPVKSLTGSASASAGSGDSGSGHIESEPSAHSSTSSFAPRAMMATH